MRRAAFPILAAFSVVVLIAGGGEPSSNASDEQPIRVTQSNYTIDYGRGIDFTMHAVSDAAAITEIKARFTPLGPGQVSSYSYLDFRPGRTIEASFSIATGVTAYFPPGTRFDVYYLITDELGNQLETDPVRVEYLEPRFEWKRKSRHGLTVLYHDRRESEIDRMLDATEAKLPLMERTLGIEAGGEYRAVLVNSRAEADIAFPFVSAASRDAHAFAGFALQRGGIFVLRGSNAGSFVHELSHLLFAEAVPSPLVNAPSWLVEGTAVYFETGSSQASARRLNRVAKRDDLLPIRAMNAVPGNLRQVATFYAKSGNFVAYLIERFGTERMTQLLAELERSPRTADAVESVYGRSLDALDAEWEAQFYGDPITPPAIGQAAEAEVTGAATESSHAPTPVPIPGPSAGPGRETRGIVLGGVLALLGLGFAVSFLRRRTKRNRA